MSLMSRRSAAATTEAFTVPSGRSRCVATSSANAQPVSWRHRVDREPARRKVAEKANLGLDDKSCREEVRNLCDHQHRDDERPLMRLEQFQGRVVMPSADQCYAGSRTWSDGLLFFAFRWS